MKGPGLFIGSIETMGGVRVDVSWDGTHIFVGAELTAERADTGEDAVRAVLRLYPEPSAGLKLTPEALAIVGRLRLDMLPTADDAPPSTLRTWRES